uniref:Uncharacterized protein n=1 Tax=Zea mays TaxID=4577 RepID=A0A804U7B8_MAIZE
MASTAYSRSSSNKLPGGERRLPPRLMRGLTSKFEPKKLGVGLVAGCCLALLTYVSLAKLFAVYSPVFASTANTSALMQQNAPLASSKPSVPETETIPPEETLDDGDGADTGDLRGTEPGLPEAAVMRNDMAAGSDEPGLPTRKDGGGNAEAEPTNKPSEDGNGGQQGGKMTCDENSVDERFPYARPTVCELSGDVRVSPKQRTVYLVNPSGGGGGGFDESVEKRLRPYARKDDSSMPHITVKSVASGAAAPECTKRHAVPAVVFSVGGYNTDNNLFDDDMTDALVPLFLTTAHLDGEVQLVVADYKPRWVRKYAPLLRKLSRHGVVSLDGDAEGEEEGPLDGVHCFPAGAFVVGLLYRDRDRDLDLSPHPARNRNPRNVTMADFARVNAADVLVGVRGAGLTNQVFLPTEAVLVQIVPWGKKIEWVTTSSYGRAAAGMGLRYLEYYVGEEETRLRDKYPRETVMEQDVVVNLTRFRPVLLQALDKLQQ